MGPQRNERYAYSKKKKKEKALTFKRFILEATKNKNLQL